MTDDFTALEELAAIDAAGGLDREEQRQLRDLLARASEEERAGVARLYEQAARMAVDEAAGGPEPSPGVRDRLMESVEASRLYTLHAGDGWMAAPLPGIKLKVLSRDMVRDTVTLLMRAEPGAQYPAHRHSGGEDCYVISGEVIIEAAAFGPATFIAPKRTPTTWRSSPTSARKCCSS
jgi:quercetin dioxygenase-like cupin family protein